MAIFFYDQHGVLRQSVKSLGAAPAKTEQTVKHLAAKAEVSAIVSLYVYQLDGRWVARARFADDETVVGLIDDPRTFKAIATTYRPLLGVSVQGAGGDYVIRRRFKGRF